MLSLKRFLKTPPPKSSACPNRVSRSAAHSSASLMRAFVAAVANRLGSPCSLGSHRKVYHPVPHICQAKWYPKWYPMATLPTLKYANTTTGTVVFIGAGCPNRTDDLPLTRRVLYQLS